MKNKFLALAAFGTAVLGGAILSAPARAQIAQGSGAKSTINVTVSVPEILYLRTIAANTITITPSQLVGSSGASSLSTTPVPGSTPPAYIGNGTPTAASTVDTSSPFSVGGTPFTVTIPKAYIVFSNSPTGKYKVAITPTFSSPIDITVDSSDVSTADITAEGLSTATPKDIVLSVDFTSDPPAGNYTGTLAIEAFRPN